MTKQTKTSAKLDKLIWLNLEDIGDGEAARKENRGSLRFQAALLADVKHRIQSAQTRAVLAVNAELVRLYWDIGQIIDERQSARAGGRP